MTKLYRSTIIFVLAVFFLFLQAIPCHAQYIYKPSDVFSVKVNSKPVFTEYYKDVPDEKTSDGTAVRWPLENVSFCHFQFTGEVTIEVTCSKDFSVYNLSPLRYQIPHTRIGNTISFKINHPGKFNINMDNDPVVNEQLFIFADGLEAKPDIKNPDVVNILKYNIDNSGKTDVTTQISNAINNLGEGQILFFPAGQYLCRSISLKSDMCLYLEDGAVLLGTEKYSDYSTEGCFVRINNCKNTSIRGLGRINQRGEKMQADYGQNAHIRNILIDGTSNNILLEDIFALDPSRLNIQVSGDKVTIRNVKALSTQSGHNTDGIDPWDCNEILYDNVFIYGRDDAIAIKGMNKTTKNIIVTNSIFSAVEGTMKIGTETKCDSIKNITFENCDALYTSTAMAIYSYDGAQIDNVFWRNCGEDRLKPSLYPNQGLNFFFEIVNRVAVPGNISNILIEKFDGKQSSALYKNRLIGFGQNSKIAGMTFKDVTISGIALTKENSFDLMENNDFVSNISFEKGVEYSIVSIKAEKQDIKEGETTNFILTRTGNLDQEAQVPIVIRGKATNGVDYIEAPSTITFRLGSSSVNIPVSALRDNLDESIEQVTVSLLPNLNRSFMLGPRFCATINISDANYKGNHIIKGLGDIINITYQLSIKTGTKTKKNNRTI